ncbi:class I adenylate-forming enzyme family protein [Allonocardiopsis opalescens]|uniref:Acyl-CoA synthetase (AMP-forming)/AMP-acid ligase II n=1 Tax=Allonocardiopsis opalescens TaxID=1144618 RepID=A0A2T0QB27_9ACTN|nr:fatty acid--CoA ligase family protein [Allonocardiopsis opalescens]PRY01020.1 acyl-CoA synthetase (AMP-forming)/AMP-acid ligase II [Allonocardiopsis opalescens]
MSHPLIEKLRFFDGADAVVFDGATHSYRELHRLVTEWNAFLDTHEVRRGEVVTLEGVSSPMACAGLIALVARGVIVVPLTPLPDAKRDEFLDVASVEVVVRIGDDGTPECERTGRTADHELYQRLREAKSPGLVLFSSGTSGRSKASVLDFDRMLARYGEPRRAKRILSFLNLDHIGGINTLLHTLSQGGTVVTVPERTPDTVFAAIAEHQVQVLPTTPTFLNMVLISRVYERYDTASLELITYGTEPMPAQTLQRLAAALPGVRLKQTYGLSELGILPTRSKSDDSLWVKLGNAGFEHKIIDGVLWIKSEMAMLGYLNAPAPFDDEGFFNTQDMVEVDGEYVRILGRKSEIINVGGEKVYPSEVESVLLEVDNIAEATVTGRPSPVTGMVVKAVVQLHTEEDPAAVSRRVREHCQARLEPFKVPAVVQVSTQRQHSDRFKKIRNLA